MGYTDQDVREGRRLMDAGRDNRLEIGDKLLAVSASGKDDVFERYCEQIGLGSGTARQYRHTSRMCTPPVRQMVAACGVHVCWSVLREGARLAPSGRPYDEDYQKLRSLLEAARQAGSDRLTVVQYQHALGVGPTLRDMLDPDTTTARDILGALRPEERDQLLREKAQEDADFCEAMKRAADEQRRKERRGRVEGPGEMPERERSLARDLVRLSDQARFFMKRYGATAAFTDQQRPACDEALGTLDVLTAWIRVRAEGQTDTAPSTGRMPARDLVGAR